MHSGLIRNLATLFNIDLNKIVLIGAGNVATHLGSALKNAGNEISQVYSKTEKSAEDLATIMNTSFTTELSEIEENADLYIISLIDDMVERILSQLNFFDKLVVHTSGFLPIDILKKVSENFGVLYPLQTFSKSSDVEMKTVPICLEANTPENLERILVVANQISDDVREVDSAQRKKLHLAAVFACNFPNFMYSIADNLLKDSNLDFDILKPLILETAVKVQNIKPSKAQTGPANRGDESIMNAHLEMLKDYPEYQKLYQAISDQIKTSPDSYRGK